MTPMPSAVLELPEDVARDLSERLAVTGEEDTARGMFFLGVLDAVRFLGGNAAVEQCLAQVGETADFVPTQNYPFARFLRLSYVASQALSPLVGGHEAAQRQIGTQAMVDFLNSMFARDFVQDAGGDPKRLMELMHSAYRTALNFGERHVEWTGPTAGRVHMKRSLMPVAYNEGVLKSALEVTGAQDVEVTGRPLSLTEAVFDLSWS
jgi:uncharacterized protein (TIGR02265 family)